METDWRAHVGRDGGLARVGLEQRERVRRAGTARRHEVEPDSLRVAWRALSRPSVAVRASLEFRHVCRLFKDVRHLDVEDVPDASSEPFDRVALFVAVRAHYELVVAQQIDDPQLWWFAFFDFEAALSQLLDELKKVECTLPFVGLKWFRDNVLPECGHGWARDPSTRHSLLRHATDQRLILTSQVPNPKQPYHPVTAIRVNRRHPRFQSEAPGRGGGFTPIRIRGGSISATVLGDRR